MPNSERMPPWLDAAHLADYGDPEIETRIAQYEMAYRMQVSVPDLVVKGVLA